MANDRINLRCRGCGAEKMLVKYYPRQFDGIWSPTEVSWWIAEHLQCSPHWGQQDLGGDRCFDLFTESEPCFTTTTA